MVKQELIIYAKHYSFTNDEGQNVEGGQIRILTDIVDVSNDFGHKKGHKVANFKISKEQASALLESVPCLADVEYDFSVGDDGTTNVFPVSVKPVKAFKVFSK